MFDQEVFFERFFFREDKEESEGEFKIKVDENSLETDIKIEDESGFFFSDRLESRELERFGSFQSVGRLKSSSSDMVYLLKGLRKKKKINIDFDVR